MMLLSSRLLPRSIFPGRVFSPCRITSTCSPKCVSRRSPSLRRALQTSSVYAVAEGVKINEAEHYVSDLEQAKKTITTRSRAKWSDQEITALLRHGRHLVPKAIAGKLGRPVRGIKTALRRLSLQEELKYGLDIQTWIDFVRRETGISWFGGDIIDLITYRNAGMPVSEVAEKLKKSVTIVIEAIQCLDSSLDQISKGPEAERKQRGATIEKDTVPPERRPDAVFEHRLTKIYNALHDSPMTLAWRQRLATKTGEEWMSLISQGILPEVKALLIKQKCPTFKEIQALPLVESQDAGVFARLVESKNCTHLPFDRRIYVGSASERGAGFLEKKTYGCDLWDYWNCEDDEDSCYGAGLCRKINDHRKKFEDIRDKGRLQREIEQNNLQWPGTFVTLMVIEFPRGGREDLIVLRTAVTLAEAILTVWLGALQSPSWRLWAAFPWNLWAKDHMPWSRYNPLETDRPLPLENPSRERAEFRDVVNRPRSYRMFPNFKKRLF